MSPTESLQTSRARTAGPRAAARVRATPEDFIVREWLGFEADGEGDHWLLTVRKRGANTHWVAKQLGQSREAFIRAMSALRD